jgi:hypothetical protein
VARDVGVLFAHVGLLDPLSLMGVAGLAPACAARQSDLDGSDRRILHRAGADGKSRGSPNKPVTFPTAAVGFSRARDTVKESIAFAQRRAIVLAAVLPDLSARERPA